MKPKSLVDFASSYSYSDKNSTVPILCKGLSNVDFEKNVIDSIVNFSGWQKNSEYILLNEFFKSRGNLENLSYFLDNISKLKNYQHGRGSELIYNYCKNVNKSRLSSDYESVFLKGLWKSHYGGRVAYKYAKYVIRNRLPVEFEKDCNDLDYLNFIESKGHDIGEVLIHSSTLSFYYYRKFCYLPEVVHNFMIAMQLSGDRYASLYFKQRSKDDKIIKNRLRMIDSSKTIAEVIRDLK